MSIRTEEATQTFMRVAGINCDNCQADIPQVFPEHSNSFLQGKGMLHVNLSGGYGEFIDGSGTAHLYPICAKALLEAFPLLSRVAYGSEIGCPDWRENPENG